MFFHDRKRGQENKKRWVNLVGIVGWMWLFNVMVMADKDGIESIDVVFKQICMVALCSSDIVAVMHGQCPYKPLECVGLQFHLLQRLY